MRLGENPSALLEWLYLEALGVRVLLWGSLVALGGCHHLDGLEQRRRIGTSWWLFVAISGDCEGICTFPDGALKGNSSKLLVSLSYLTCGSVLAVSNRVDEVCETPLSHRTTKCWSTQWGRSVLASTWTSGENRLSLAICILPVIGLFFILWLVHFPTRQYNRITYSFTFPQTRYSKLFSVARIESLHCVWSLSSGAL